jgi:hypothetical protein
MVPARSLAAACSASTSALPRPTAGDAIPSPIPSSPRVAIADSAPRRFGRQGCWLPERGVARCITGPRRKDGAPPTRWAECGVQQIDTRRRPHPGESNSAMMPLPQGRAQWQGARSSVRGAPRSAFSIPPGRRGGEHRRPRCRAHQHARAQQREHAEQAQPPTAMIVSSERPVLRLISTRTKICKHVERHGEDHRLAIMLNPMRPRGPRPQRASARLTLWSSNAGASAPPLYNRAERADARPPGRVPPALRDHGVSTSNPRTRELDVDQGSVSRTHSRSPGTVVRTPLIVKVSTTRVDAIVHAAPPSTVALLRRSVGRHPRRRRSVVAALEAR